MSYSQPLLLLFVTVLALAVGLFKRGYPSLALRLVTAAASGIFLCSWPPTAALLVASLEAWYPAGLPRGDAEVIVVLSANLHSPIPPWPERIAGPATYLRCRCAAWLYHNWKAVPVVASGGIDGDGAIVAGQMAAILESDGVPHQDVWLEARSTSTYENARFTAELLTRRGIRRVALVTEAYHMLRASRSFRRQGLEVIPAPCGYRSLNVGWRWIDLIPNPRSLQTVEDTLHELLGLAWYGLLQR